MQHQRAVRANPVVHAQLCEPSSRLAPKSIAVLSPLAAMAAVSEPHPALKGLGAPAMEEPRADLSDPYGDGSRTIA